MSDVKQWTPGLHDMWLVTEASHETLDASKIYYRASDYDALASRLAEAERWIDRALAVLPFVQRNHGSQLADEVAQLIRKHPLKSRAVCTKPLPDPCDEREPVNNCRCPSCALSPRHQSAEGAEGEGT